MRNLDIADRFENFLGAAVSLARLLRDVPGVVPLVIAMSVGRIVVPALWHLFERRRLTTPGRVAVWAAGLDPGSAPGGHRGYDSRRPPGRLWPAMMRSLYRELLERHGQQGWWPLWDRGGLRYRPGDYTVPEGRDRAHVIQGAILAQNTRWSGAAEALGNLVRAGLDRWPALAGEPHESLEQRLRPARFYRQKARRLQVAARFFGERDGAPPDRDELLELWGIGPETADSVLLYAYGVPVMVVDAYLRRVLRDRGREEVAEGDYEAIRAWTEERLPSDAVVLNEAHALVVAEGKRISEGQGG